MFVIYLLLPGTTGPESQRHSGIKQRAKKVMSASPGLVDFAIVLAIVVLNLPNGQVLFFWEIQITEGL